MRNKILPLILCTTLILVPGQVYVFEVPAKSIRADVAPLNLKTLIRLYPLIVNGSFFDPPTKTVLGFVVSDSKVLNKGVFKDAIVVKDGKAELTTLKDATNLNIDFAISGGPVLVKNGKVVVGKERSEVRLSLACCPHYPPFLIIAYSSEFQNPGLGEGERIVWTTDYG